MTAHTADVVVVGGGAVGVSAAYHLAAAGAGSVLLLERADELGTGATGACAGGFRHQFSSEINIRLSLASIPMITGFEQTHGIPLDIAQDGYLFLVRGRERWDAYVAACALQRSLGVDARLLSPQDAAELAPGIAPEGIVGAAYCPDDGIADPSGLTLGYATAARRAGAVIDVGVDVTGLRVEHGRVAGVRSSGGDVETRVVVNAAGPWGGVFAAAAGVEIPLEPVPRNVATTGPFPGVPDRRTLVIDAETGFYFHREGSGVLMGMGSPSERSSFDTRPDETFIAEQIVPTAVRVFPPLELAGIARTWAGLYEMTPDRHPIIAEASALDGFYLANGFSGHGFQHAPIVGKLLAEMIVDGRASTVDVSRLGLDRFVNGGLRREGHVV